jgi:flagellar basal-body rod modification protein FlgD
MTTVPSTSSVGSTSSTASTTTTAAASATVDYNEFLQLMVAELKNQDPTSPTDPTQFMSQLASFSSVEQQVNTNSRLDTMLTSQALTQADASLGRTYTSLDGTTTGVISSVAISSSGALTATLANGTTVALGSGEQLS